MTDTGKRYVYLDAPILSPQSIPNGFGGFYDWRDLSNTEKAKRGWVLDTPPDFDQDWQRVERTPDGKGGVAYTTVPADLDHAQQTAFRILGERANRAEHAPFAFKSVPIPFTKKAQGRIEDYADRAKANRDFAVKEWKVAPGRFVSFSNAEPAAAVSPISA